MARVLVTGGAGFIGSHLCERLLQLGNEVICLDNFFTGRKSNIAHLEDNSSANNSRQGRRFFEVIRHDIIEPILLEVDEIYHLACPASPVHYQYNSVKTIKTSVLGTINMLGLAKRVRAKFLLASTSEVYGDPQIHPQPESYWGNVNPVGIRSCYDEGKRVAETLTMDYHRQADLDVKIVRIFNTYGPRMLFDDGRVVSNFIVQALSAKPITLYGNGLQTRSFCYVDDMVEGLLAMMACNNFTGPVNLGNPSEITVKELADHILRLSGSQSSFIKEPLPADDPSRRKPDIALAKEKLHWNPKVDLNTGLQETIADFKIRLEKC